MKLEYLDDISDGGKYPGADPDKLIRLYDFDLIELEKLKRAIQKNLIDKGNELVISNLSYVQPLNCTLTFLVSDLDLGVKFPPEKGNNFFGRFSKHNYRDMLLIIDSLTYSGYVNGYNWLYDPGVDEKIDLLLSSGVGGW
jgi:hypothetical protein